MKRSALYSMRRMPTAAAMFPNVIEDDHCVSSSNGDQPRPTLRDSIGEVNDTAARPTTQNSAIIEDWNEECSDSLDIIPAGEVCKRQRCVLDFSVVQPEDRCSPSSSSTLLRMGNNAGTNFDEAIALAFDLQQREEKSFEESLSMHNLGSHALDDMIVDMFNETAESEPTESDRKLSPQEMKLLREARSNEPLAVALTERAPFEARIETGIVNEIAHQGPTEYDKKFSPKGMATLRQTQWDEDYAFALAEQERREAAGTAAGSNEEKVKRGPTESDTKFSPEEIKLLRQLYHGEPTLSDEYLAYALAEQERQDVASTTITGRAWSFVQAVIAEHGHTTRFTTERVATSFCELETTAPSATTELIGTDDMLFMVERMIELQALFESKDKNTRVDIGFHYTRGSNLEKIRENGLLTKSERVEKGVVSNYNGSCYGDGIYTGNNPFSFRRYGDICLLVARLRGWSEIYSSRVPNERPDTFIVHPESPGEMVILAQSCQCVPLVSFSVNHLDAHGGRDDIWSCQNALQKLLDRYFNDMCETKVPPWTEVEDNRLARRGRLAHVRPVPFSRPVAPCPPDIAPYLGLSRQLPVADPVGTSGHAVSDPSVLMTRQRPFIFRTERHADLACKLGSESLLSQRLTGGFAPCPDIAPYPGFSRQLPVGFDPVGAIGHATNPTNVSDALSDPNVPMTRQSSFMFRTERHADSECKRPSESLLSPRLTEGFGPSPSAHTTWYQAYRAKQLSDDADNDVKRPCPEGCIQSQTFTRKSINNCTSSLEETMRVSTYPKETLCCDGGDTIVVVYTFHTTTSTTDDKKMERTQKNRIAFFPSSTESQGLLLRLRLAFDRYIITDGVTWNSIIPHRTSPYIPYPNFASFCNKALDELGVPDSSSSAAITKHPDNDPTSLVVSGGQFGRKIGSKKIE